MNLFEKNTLSNTLLELSSRVVMAPLTRCRAINGNIPNKIMAEYYAQRASAGLIITEGTSPSPNGLGYTNIPGMYSKEHVDGWKKTTQAVHEKGGKIFLQMMHTGRIGHTENLPENAILPGPSAIAMKGEIKTYSLSRKAYPVPVEMDGELIQSTIEEYVQSAKMCMEAGFDGIEIHGAHGYLPNQFINTASNQRTDQYGGNMENRCRFMLEVMRACTEAIGADKVGLRISPFSYADVEEDAQDLITLYTYLVKELDQMNLAYLHLSHMGEPTPVKFELWKSLRQIFKGSLIICGDFTKEEAQKALTNGDADLIAFGRDYIANPDLVERMKNDWPIEPQDRTHWYSWEAKGYNDYAAYKA